MARTAQEKAQLATTQITITVDMNERLTANFAQASPFMNP